MISSNQAEQTIGELLRRRGWRLAVAESCTGGLIASRITDIPGSSDYFQGGIVAYSYEAKVSLLGVSWTTLRTYGAVSRETVLAMARGARTSLQADVAMSVSGIAGPGGGLPDKPVGTTWIGLSVEQGEWARHFLFHKDRLENKSSSVDEAFKLLIEFLEGRLG